MTMASRVLERRLSFGCGQVTLAIWNARLADEEWKTDPKENKLLGRRVRRPFGYGFAKGRIVAYLPEGKLEEEEYEMWHVIHDHDGDHEDLEKAEIELAIQAWEEYTEQEYALAAGEGPGSTLEGGLPAAPVKTYVEGEDVLCGSKGDGKLWKAKVVEVREAEDEEDEEDQAAETGEAAAGPSYLVHYHGWKKSFDEWCLPTVMWKADDEEAIALQEQMEVEKEVEQMAAKAGGKRLRVKLPAVLQARIGSEYHMVVDEQRLLVLPRVPTVVQILQQWLETAHRPDDPDALAVVTWLIDYFNQALPKVLLYGSEVWQLEEIGIAQTKSKIKMEYGEIYGAEHLTRLLTKLPDIVNAQAIEAYTEAYHSGGEPPPPTDWKELVRTPPPDAF